MPNRKQFKCPPKRFQPRGISVLYEDYDILVVDKASGLLTVSTGREMEKTAYFLLNDYVRKGIPKSKNRIFIVHRLDRDTSGVIVFAKSEEAKRQLQDDWRTCEKKYLAVVHGTMAKKEGSMSSYLAENAAHRMYSVSDPEKGKLAETRYKVLRESKNFSLLEIELLTGRKNQIRVHLADEGHPVAGDEVYGNGEKNRSIKRLALHAASLTLNHPVTGERMTFEAQIPSVFAALVRGKGDFSA
jgi:tRNA pseudouridine32 synthase/23S rRNA pseudouridine746 synthase/23S rRNA pseudouridine1911/1915/1917 synthase